MIPQQRAKQMNVSVNTDVYTEQDLIHLENEGAIVDLNKRIGSEGKYYVVGLQNVREIKVILDKDGYYTNVVITKDGWLIYIKL